MRKDECLTDRQTDRAEFIGPFGRVWVYKELDISNSGNNVHSCWHRW